MSEDRSFAVTVAAAASAFAVSAAALVVSIVGMKSSMEESDQRIAEQMKNVELLQQSVRQEIGAYTKNVEAHNQMMIKNIKNLSVIYVAQKLCLGAIKTEHVIRTLRKSN